MRLLSAVKTCAKPLRRVNFWRAVVDDVCTREANHDGDCVTHIGERYITVDCYECGKPARVPDSKHCERAHDGCLGYPYCACKTPH